jgi:hypothetical protein
VEPAPRLNAAVALLAMLTIMWLPGCARPITKATSATFTSMEEKLSAEGEITPSSQLNMPSTTSPQRLIAASLGGQALEYATLLQARELSNALRAQGTDGAENHYRLRKSACWLDAAFYEFNHNRNEKKFSDYAFRQSLRLLALPPHQEARILTNPMGILPSQDPAYTLLKNDMQVVDAAVASLQSIKNAIQWYCSAPALACAEVGFLHAKVIAQLAPTMSKGILDYAGEQAIAAYQQLKHQPPDCQNAELNQPMIKASPSPDQGVNFSANLLSYAEKANFSPGAMLPALPTTQSLRPAIPAAESPIVATSNHDVSALDTSLSQSVQGRQRNGDEKSEALIPASTAMLTLQENIRFLWGGGEIGDMDPASAHHLDALVERMTAGQLSVVAIRLWGNADGREHQARSQVSALAKKRGESVARYLRTLMTASGMTSPPIDIKTDSHQAPLKNTVRVELLIP